MKIGSIGQLEVFARADQEVYNILTDLTISRRKVVELLSDKNIEVSEKLVRTYRNKINAAYSTLSEVLGKIIEDSVEAQMTPPIFNNISNNEVTTAIFSDNEVVAFPIKTGKVQSAKTTIIMPDVQAPLHDVALVNKFIDFLEDFQPDELVQVGDFTDSTAIGRWVRGKRGEFAGDLQSGFDITRAIFEDIRSVFDGRFRIVRSNHDDRLEIYIEGCAPGLQLRDLTIEKQTGMDDNDIEFVRDALIEVVKDQLVVGHGDEGSLSPQAGKTAFGLAKNKFGVSTICGHTHRAGVTSESYGYNGRITSTLTGMEVGHFMDLQQAEYLRKKGGTANWQQAFGIVEQIHGKTFQRLIMVDNGEFYVDGELY